MLSNDDVRCPLYQSIVDDYRMMSWVLYTPYRLWMFPLMMSCHLYTYLLWMLCRESWLEVLWMMSPVIIEYCLLRLSNIVSCDYRILFPVMSPVIIEYCLL
jgi:hypothetical protein